MTGAAWATLLITFAVAISTPGPDLFMLLRLAMRERRAAVLAACGIMVGNTVWTLASVLGLSALLQALPGVLPALQIAGSAVLIYMGVMSIRGGMAARRAARESTRIAQPATGGSFDGSTDDRSGADASNVTVHPLRLGLITNLSNPKALLFFTALFSQILPPEATWIDRGAILLALTAVGLSWFVGFAVLASSKAFQRWFGRATPYIDLAAGVVFVLVACVILGELVLSLG